MVRLIDPIVPEGDGHTLLAADEVEGLRLSWVATRGDLNRAEHRNITDALARRKPPPLVVLLDDLYLRDLHKAMFRRVWRWAGTYRLRETNLGIEPIRIPGAVRDLVADAAYWPAQEPPDVVVARFHHRLVGIHPFPNGNGRHGRIAANYLALALGVIAPTWGAASGWSPEEVRARYLAAMREGDKGNLAPLTRFLRA